MCGGWGTSLRNSSFILKVFFSYVLAVAVFAVFLFVFFFRRISDDGVADQAAALGRYARLMDGGALAAARSREPAALRSYAADRAKLLSARVTWIAPDGTVLADTEENPAYMENHAGRPEVKKALAGEDNYLVRFSATLKKDMLYFAHPVWDRGAVAGVLRLSVDMADLNRLLAGVKAQYLLIVSFLVVVSGAALVVVHGYFKRAIGRFSLASRRVADGDFDVGFPGSDSFEIRELSKSFEAMVRKIRTLVSDLVAEKNEIESIVAAAGEGIAVIDGRGVVVRANRGFEAMFDFPGAAGRFYWEVIRSNELVETIRTGREGGRSAVELDERTLLCGLTRLAERDETILTCADVTQVKNWETVKKDLVTNVSHELGTPLTAIKGYVETLFEEETDERKKRFLGIVARHAERLANITKDLLTLSRLEDARAARPTERVSLDTVLDNVLPLFRGRAEAKGLELAVRAEENLPAIQGDSFAIEQAFINLLDNAVKYTEKGFIRVALLREGARVKVEIADSGIGIPERDLDRIFERFYVVDKSRSRSLGGTGLGLSIVKHIVARHGGEIGVKSVLGNGTTFTIFLPASSE
jgi:two-component system phosphate regulon sensor histidine kinase PhoR